MVRRRSSSFLAPFSLPPPPGPPESLGASWNDGWGAAWAAGSWLVGCWPGAGWGAGPALAGALARRWLGSQAGAGWGPRQVLVGVLGGCWLGFWAGAGWGTGRALACGGFTALTPIPAVIHKCLLGVLSFGCVLQVRYCLVCVDPLYTEMALGIDLILVFSFPLGTVFKWWHVAMCHLAHSHCRGGHPTRRTTRRM